MSLLGWLVNQTPSPDRKLSREVASLKAALASVTGELTKAREELECEQRKVRVQQVELDQLAAIIARDRERVLAETRIAANETGGGTS